MNHRILEGVQEETDLHVVATQTHTHRPIRKRNLPVEASVVLTSNLCSAAVEPEVDQQGWFLLCVDHVVPPLLLLPC